MSMTESIFIIVGICVLVLTMGVLRRKKEWIINFVLRMVLGALLIFFINEFLSAREIDALVGINGMSLGIAGLLGLPGLLLLYGINLFLLI